MRLCGNRFTLCPYSYDENTIGDPLVHLTNAAVQKKHPSYADRKETQVWNHWAFQYHAYIHLYIYMHDLYIVYILFVCV